MVNDTLEQVSGFLPLVLLPAHRTRSVVHH